MPVVDDEAVAADRAGANPEKTAATPPQGMALTSWPLRGAGAWRSLAGRGCFGSGAAAGAGAGCARVACAFTRNLCVDEIAMGLPAASNACTRQSNGLPGTSFEATASGSATRVATTLDFQSAVRSTSITSTE